MIDRKDMQVGQKVYLTNEWIIGADTMPYLVVEGHVTKTYPSTNAPTFYIKHALTCLHTGPFLMDDAYTTEAEALVAAVKLASRKMDEVAREAHRKVNAISKLVEGHIASGMYAVQQNERKHAAALVDILHATNARCSFDVLFTPKGNPCVCTQHQQYHAARGSDA